MHTMKRYFWNQIFLFILLLLFVHTLPSRQSTKARSSLSSVEFKILRESSDTTLVWYLNGPVLVPVISPLANTSLFFTIAEHPLEYTFITSMSFHQPKTCVNFRLGLLFSYTYNVPFCSVRCWRGRHLQGGWRVSDPIITLKWYRLLLAQVRDYWHPIIRLVRFFTEPPRNRSRGCDVFWWVLWVLFVSRTALSCRSSVQGIIGRVF